MQSSQDLTAASGTERRKLLSCPGMMTDSKEAASDTEPVQVSPYSQQRCRQDDIPQATILIIDDEAPVRETLVEVLSIHSYHVITASSVEEAEENKRRLGVEGLHLVITDVHLTPAAQARAGYVLAQRWRTQHPELPIILISGDPSTGDLPDVHQGWLRFLLKPFGLKAFLETIKEALGR